MTEPRHDSHGEVHGRSRDGVPVVRRFDENLVVLGGRRFALTDKPADAPMYMPSRPFLEQRVRARFAARPRVEIRAATEVVGLTAADDGPA